MTIVIASNIPLEVGKVTAPSLGFNNQREACYNTRAFVIREATEKEWRDQGGSPGVLDGLLVFYDYYYEVQVLD